MADPATTTDPAAPAATAATATEAVNKTTVRFHNQDVELTPEQLKNYAQMGLAAGNLEEKRKKFQDEQKLYEQRLKAGGYLEEIAQNDPEKFGRLKKVLSGAKLAEEVKRRADPEADDDTDAEDPEESRLTRRAARPTVPSVDEERILRLERRLDQSLQSFDQRDQDSRIKAALDSQEVFRSADQAIRDIGERLVRDSLAKGEFETADQAAVAHAAPLKRFGSEKLEAERRERERKAETAAPRSAPPSAAIPRLDPKDTSLANLKNGNLAKMLKERVRATMNPNP